MSIRRVAAQLGHADPAFTLRVYAHILPDGGEDLGFLAFDQQSVRGATRATPRTSGAI